MNPEVANRSPVQARLRLAVRGAVQGVGFRPFVYRLANELGLVGWVNNSPQGVTIEIEGNRRELEQFCARLAAEKPPRSFIQSCETTWLDVVGYDGFVIRDSERSGDTVALVMPDLATCPDCLRDISDPANRRHRYPFTNCTNCGPRFSIIDALPYDRANTSMRDFKMCPACQAEYDDPKDRRFHAQPNACPDCGPRLELWPGAANYSPEAQPEAGESPRALAVANDALLAAAHVIRCGQILAVKGIGGFHLIVDARNEAAVHRLRERKHREEKPFALMFPTLASIKAVCEVSPLEERLLQSPEAPIVLLRKLVDCKSQIVNSVAPGNPNLGVMLPSNPLHHLLMTELGFPVVATSGNLRDEPICTDEFEALQRLRDIADVFLVHNRPIARHVDDSIVRVMLDREMVLRRARGFAPLPLTLGHQPSTANPQAVLGVGAHLKNSVALALGEQVFLSQHVGDLETEQAQAAFRRVVAELPQLYAATPTVIAADLHPNYLSTQFSFERQTQVTERGASRGSQLFQVQHHVAHVWSSLAENEVALPALGVAWDGTGFGSDGVIWGGEFFRVDEVSVERVAHWRTFSLPGGEAAIKSPRRVALGVLFELFGEGLLHRDEFARQLGFDRLELSALTTMLARGLNAPRCCSVGRLFDAVAALVGLRRQISFEGQAAMELEFAALSAATDAAYELEIKPGEATPMTLDWAKLIHGLWADAAEKIPVGVMAAKFHNTLAEAMVAVAKQVGCERVALSGGCFQNRYLLERAVKRLRTEGFQPYWHQRVPANDGGIALGQVIAARREIQSVEAVVNPLHLSPPAVGDDSRRLLQTRS